MLKILNQTDMQIIIEDIVKSVPASSYVDVSIHDEYKWQGSQDLIIQITLGNVTIERDGVEHLDYAKQIKALNNNLLEVDENGRQIMKHAATYKGWHYQAHSVQFEVNKLGSVYNKDRDGNDLGFTTMKIYDATGVELTTQADVDLYGVKTVCKWSPSFDLDIISGNVRQATKESIDSYIYVDAVVPTGYPAPYDKLYVPFTTGGINLKYIGADEQLKTDGRAGKTIKCSEGAYFEITVNYEADILTNENRHELSVIFEIYKDPTV